MQSSVRVSHTLSLPALLGLWAFASIGCVSTETHTKALTELEATKKQLASLQTNLDQEASKRKAAEQQAASLTQERDALSSRSNELQAQLDGLEKEKSQLNGELANVRSQITDLEQKHASGSASAQEEIDKLKQLAAAMEAEAAQNAKDRERLRHEQTQLATDLEQARQRADAEAAEKARLEKDRLAKEEEVRRLTRTQEELSKSLQDEISKGNITIQQVRDKLTINMVDRVLFDSGQAQVKPDGIKVLKQVGDILKTVEDKQIRIEGHTDNVPISAKLQSRYKTNWELSTARATNVVRYLIDHGGVNRQYLSAVGYADTRPIASNDSDEGRSSNRRIEIVLHPKDLTEITGELQSSAQGGQ
jgi:chemotaxis protein MotB